MAAPCCGTGTLHEGAPVGREETVHGLPCYISEPPSAQDPKGIIVIIPDALGWKFINQRIIADKFAKRTGARVYMPEFMNGNSMDPSLFKAMDELEKKGSWLDTAWKIFPLATAVSNFVPFLFKNRLSVAKPRVYKFFHDLRANEGTSLPVGAVGYCWGGKYTFLLCSDSEKAINGKCLVDCGFTAHPSNLSVPADAEAVVLPLSVACGDHDMVLSIDQLTQMKEILEKKDKEKHEVVVIPGATHGFAVRGNPAEPKAVEFGTQAEDQAVDWFLKWFGATKN
ncbi:hypothetical protein MMC19_004376 [Ptychographa xylographoides]|nr:hypothetical protein [Ptychographa xylographoides]